MASKNFGQSLFIGEDATRQPVFFDPHLPIYYNLPPVTLITGSPGSGKTFFGCLLCAHSSLLQKKTIVLDPKDDFSAPLKYLSHRGDINDVEIWKVFNTDGTTKDSNIGVLDPTALYDDYNENAVLTLDVIKSLTSVSPELESTIIPIILDVVSDSQPTFSKLIYAFRRSQNDSVSSLGHSIGLFLNDEIAKLLSIDRRLGKPELKFDSGTTIISLVGLDLPSPNANKDTYSTKQKISIVIMTLITRLILEIMKYGDESEQKTIIIDEAWSVLSSEKGESMVNELALLGRSRNVATILLTQSPKHISSNEKGDSELDNTISTRFAFRNTSSKDNEITVRAMNLEEDIGWEGAIEGFSEKGQCLMMDFMGDVGVFFVMAPEKWVDIFGTNPIDLKRKLNEEL